MKKKISIIVPVYKEEKTIPLFMERFYRVVAGQPWDYELLFALDPSPDRTSEVIRQLMAVRTAASRASTSAASPAAFNSS